MADEHRTPPAAHPPAPHHARDGELDLKSIVGFGLGLAGITLVVLALMWGMQILFKQAEEAHDRPPPPLAEALADPIPKGPRLQSAPPRDMDELRAQDREALTTYGWVDQSGGLARIPIDRAMSIVAERGLGVVSDKKKEAK